MNQETVSFLKGKKISVLGMGRSGKAVAKLLSDVGAKVFCSDSGNVEGLESLGLPFETGGHSERIFASDMIVVSPGIPMDSEVLVKARSLSIPLRGELDLAAELLPCSYAAVTGTSGKSTTTALIAHMLNKAGIKSRPVGNIGDALSNHVAEAQPDWVLSIEVSSFQCELMETFHPKTAVFTNLSQDHLNRHTSMEEYASLKEKVLARMDGEDLAVVNADDKWSSSLDGKTCANVASFSRKNGPNIEAYFDGKDIYIRGKRVSSLSDYQLVGDFNALNLMAASLAVSRFGVDSALALTTAKDFVPLDHRLQFVGEWGGIRFINDSKSTKPEATILAVKSLPGPFVIILGGSEKGSDFSELAGNFGEVRYAVLHGITAPKIEKALRDGGFDRIVVAKDQSEAIRKAIKVAKPGDTVLLSPACASFDQFKDYEHRGRMFCQEVRELAQKGLRF